MCVCVWGVVYGKREIGIGFLSFVQIRSYVNINPYTYAYMYVCIYVYMCVCIHIYIYTHTYAYIDILNCNGKQKGCRQQSIHHEKFLKGGVRLIENIPG